MAASPMWKVFNPAGEYVASCKYAEDAAAIVGSYGGGEIRVGHSKRLTVWREGQEKAGTATDSYDIVAKVCHERLDQMLNQSRAARAAIAAAEATDTQPVQPALAALIARAKEPDTNAEFDPTCLASDEQMDYGYNRAWREARRVLGLESETSNGA